MKKNLALIGLGGWGRNILRNLVDMDVLLCAYDINPDTIQKYKKQAKKLT